MYGEGPALTAEQALARYLGGQTAGTFTGNNGQVTLAQFRALFPNATKEEIARYSRIHQAYVQGTSGTGGVGNSLGKAAEFELDHVGNIFEGLVDEPGRLVFGFDPIGTEIGNAVTGSNYDPLVNQMGGATSEQIAAYEAQHGLNSAGGAQGLHDAAAGTAAVITAGTLANGGLTGGQGGGPTSIYQGGYNGNFVSGAAPGAESGALAGMDAATANALLEEIVVTGVVPAGLTSADVAALGAIAAGAGGVAAAAGAGGGGAPTNYGDYGGWQPNTDPVGSVGSGIGSGGNTGDLVLSGGAGNGLPEWMSGFGGGGGSMWEDLIPLAGQLLGSWMEGRGADKASEAQIKAALAAIAEQRRQYDTSRADQMPWLEAGRAALARLTDPNAFTTSPGYEFVRREGNRDIGNSFAARGGALSGNALRALDNYNTGLASQEYNNWFNQNASIAGIGQASAQNLGALGQSNANNVSNLLTNQGNARASGILGQTDAYTNGLNQLGQWYGNYRRSRQGGF